MGRPTHAFMPINGATGQSSHCFRYQASTPSSPMQQAHAVRCPALDNRPTHRSLRYRRGPATSGAASLPARCDGRKRSAHSRCMRGCSSVGRALQSHCRGQGFDSPQLHSPRLTRHGFRLGKSCPPPLGRTESSNDGARGTSREVKANGQEGRALRANRLRSAFFFRPVCCRIVTRPR